MGKAKRSKNRHESFADQKASVVHKPPSRLLQLRSELRDIIYEYALTEEGGIVSTYINSRGDKIRFRATTRHQHATKSQEVNQLRYVCRQLKAETTGLGFRYNDINFTETRIATFGEPANGYVSFLVFTNICSPSNLQFIRRMIIEWDLPTTYGTPSIMKLLAKIRDFCYDNPQIIVINRFPEPLDPIQPHDISYMDAFSRLLRGTSSLPNLAYENNADNQEGLEWFVSFECPANLRFRMDYYFEEDMVRKSLALYFAGEELEHWVKVAAKMHENGI